MFKRFRCKVPMNLQKFAEGGSGDGGAAGASGADGGTSPANLYLQARRNHSRIWASS